MVAPDGSAVDRTRVRRAVSDSIVAEVATARDGRPAVFPLSPFYDDDREAIVVSSPPAYAGKVEHVRENPTVLVNLYDGDERLQIRGEATVRDDDVHANREYVASLIRGEGNDEKRHAFESGGSVLESPLGRLLMDWYALRVVVEIEPTEVLASPAVEGPPAVSAWGAVGMDGMEADSYERVVFGSVSADGPEVTPVERVAVEGDVATLTSPALAAVAVEAGAPACLLCHWHSPDVRRLGQRLVRGRCLEADDDVVRFRQASTFSMRQSTPVDLLRSVVRGKRRTGAYFGESNPLKWFW